MVRTLGFLPRRPSSILGRVIPFGVMVALETLVFAVEVRILERKNVHMVEWLGNGLQIHIMQVRILL